MVFADAMANATEAFINALYEAIGGGSHVVGGGARLVRGGRRGRFAAGAREPRDPQDERQHRRAGIVDVEKILQVGEIVGGADFFDRREGDGDVVALRQFEQQQALPPMTVIALTAHVMPEHQTRAQEVAEVRLHAPLLHLSKAEIIRRGRDLGVDYGLTTSCYDPGPEGGACGHCDACQLRLKGFSENQMVDPGRAQRESDIVVFLVGHRQFKRLDPNQFLNKVVVDAIGFRTDELTMATSYSARGAGLEPCRNWTDWNACNWYVAADANGAELLDRRIRAVLERWPHRAGLELVLVRSPSGLLSTTGRGRG